MKVHVDEPVLLDEGDAAVIFRADGTVEISSGHVQNIDEDAPISFLIATAIAMRMCDEEDGEDWNTELKDWFSKRISELKEFMGSTPSVEGSKLKH